MKHTPSVDLGGEIPISGIPGLKENNTATKHQTHPQVVNLYKSYVAIKCVNVRGDHKYSLDSEFDY